MKKISVVGPLIACLAVVFTYAQSQQAVQNQYIFKYLTVDQGLSNNNIRSICQDSKGFIWIATQNGANKFDGQTIVTYRHDPQDSNSISSDRLNSIFLDSKNNLWFCSNQGLSIYNGDFDNFIRFSHKDIDWKLDDVEQVVEDKDGKIWIADRKGLICYNQSASEVIFFSTEEDNPHGLPSNRIYRLLIDKNNNIWISILNEGLCIYNQSDGSFKFFRNDPDDPSTISGNRIETIYEDSEGNIWVGTMNNGLNRYMPESNSFIRIIPDPEKGYSTRVRTIFEDLNGNFFIGTRVGLYIRIKGSDSFVPYAYKGHNFSDLSQNSIWCSYIDNTRTLWIGTFSGGVNYSNLNRKEFIHYKAGKGDDQFLNGSNIYSITEDSEGNLWIGGDNGLNYLDRKTYRFRHYTNNPDDPNSISYNDIKTLEWDKKGNLWIGTNKGGLNYYNVKTGKFKSFRHDPENPYSIAGDKIYCLLNDRDNNLWIMLSPLNDFNFLHIDILPDGSDKFIHLNERSYLGFDQNDKGDVYIGGVNGFWIYTGKDSVFTFIPNDTLIDKVNTIRKDSEDRLWIGSQKGLVRYDMDEKSFIWFSEDNGYPVGEVYGILEDNQKNLWVSTNSGLIKIANIVEDVTKINFRVFDREDGLQSKQFNYNAYYKCKSGEMAFGGINGFNTFQPSEIVEYPIPPNVVLTDLKVFNKSIPIGEKVAGRLILNKSISVTDEIELGRKQNVFSLEFAALHYANPDNNMFKFKLDGFDKEWQYRKASNNLATYTNLPAGEYTFLITASNNDGVWNQEPLKLKITIIPPFWKTWWFILFACFGLIGLFFGTYFYRLSAIRKQNLELEKTVEKRTQVISDTNKKLLEANVLLEKKQEEIESQNEELEKHRKHLKSLVNDRTLKLENALIQAKKSEELKSAFLANMSHEIRTPMNAITGFTTLLNESGLTDEERNEYIQIIESNSESLLKIIDEILDMSLIESNQLKLAIETFDLNIVIDHLFSYYFLNNKNSKVVVRKNNKLQNLNMKLCSDSVRLKQIIINLMDNAVKFTEEGHIELGTYIDKNNICIYVEDTGRGIPPEMKDQIFQQFTKLDDNEAQWTRGLGLGLAISQKIAFALGGEILVKSSKGKGSTFTFSLPLESVKTLNEIIHEEPKETIPSGWEGKTILIAEDVEANYLYLKSVLKKTEVNLIWAKNGKEALKEATDNHKVDLILMDIKLPVMDGKEAAEKIKKHNKNIPVIAQTAYARPEEKLKFYDENFDEYISKPINPRDLLSVLQQFLGGL